LASARATRLSAASQLIPVCSQHAPQAYPGVGRFTPRRSRAAGFAILRWVSTTPPVSSS